MSDSPIYLDHNSTTPIDPRVVEAMTRAWRDCGANPASQHAPGRRARRMLEEAREGIAELLGAKTGGMDADRVIFTSGGTEANNLALRGLLPTPIAGGKSASGAAENAPTLIVSAIEHPSVIAAAHEFRRTTPPKLFRQAVWSTEIEHDPHVSLRAETEPYRSDSGELLLLQINTGNPAAFLQLTRRYREPVLQVLERVSGSRSLAEDLVWSVFLDVMLEGPRYQSSIPFDKWLAEIATNVAKNSPLQFIPARSDGLVDVDRLLRFVRCKRTKSSNTIHEVDAQRLVSVMLANNETGIVQPVAEVARICGQCQVTVHIDAVQAVGKMPVHFRELGVDVLTVAPHKFHGPLGIGALVLKHGVKLQPQLHGGFQQEALRPGTENVALAVGFHGALEIAVKELPEREPRMRSLRDELERLLVNDLPDAIIIGQDSPRLPNTSCISFPGVDRQALVMALDMAGVACSTGSACASGSSEPSPTLVAMGLPKGVIAGAIRLSLGAFTTADEVAEAARRIIKAVKHLRSRNSG